MIKLLIENGADINVRNKRNNTPLLQALAQGKNLKSLKHLHLFFEKAKALSIKFVDVFHCTLHCIIPVETLSAKITSNVRASYILGFRSVAELLIQKGVDVDVVGSGTGYTNNTALIDAAWQGILPSLFGNQ